MIVVLNMCVQYNSAILVFSTSLTNIPDITSIATSCVDTVLSVRFPLDVAIGIQTLYGAD